MNRATRTKLLINVGRKQAIDMAQTMIENYEVFDLQPAREGLVMIKLRESAQQSLFYIGEVLVTEAKVKLQNALGVGLVIEHEPELARALAIIDAAYNANLPEIEEWEVILNELQLLQQQAQQEVKRSIERTKVQFDTMTT
ncbi:MULTISPECIES: phosphonate C-P lyase system protein PhnG [unclassified Solibacillus]|uniref:phosphonate C-P lyase system protein PhnG n=1 Tax=unclassified Solibacillus TaxID=2637870 RepID=UPI0030F8D0E5